MYNKNQFKKVEDRKVLHKIKKRWVTVSIALLGMIGGGAIATNVSANTNTSNQNNNNNKFNQQVSTNQLQQQPKLVNNQVSQNNSNNQNTQSSNTQVQDITKNANQLHNRILINSVNRASALAPQSLGLNSLRNANAISTPLRLIRETSAAQSGSAFNSVAINSVVSSKSMIIPTSASASIPTSSFSNSTVPTPSSSSASKSSINVNNQIKTGVYYGLNYKYNPNTKYLEFTNGTLTWNGVSDGNFAPFLSSSFSKSKNPLINKATSVKFDDAVDTSHVTNMNDMFCLDNLQSLDLGNNFNTSNVTEMSDMFADTNLESLKLPTTFNTSKVTNMSGMFSSDNNLLYLDLPDTFYTNNVTNMSSMFSEDKNLKTLILPEAFDTSHVTNMGGMFELDDALQSLNLPESFDTNNVTDMSDMFSDDDALQSLTVHSSNTKFNNTVKLMPLYLKNNYDNYTTFNPVTINQEGTYVPHGNVQTGVYNGLDYKYEERSKTLDFTGGTLNWDGNHSNNNAFIGTSDNAPSDIHNAEHIEFNKGINMNNVTSLHNMFLNNIHVRSIDLSNLDTSHITNMNGMFNGDIDLNLLNLNGFNTSNVTDMDYMFNGNNLNSLDLSSFDTRKASMAHFFDGDGDYGYTIPTELKIGPLTKFNSDALNFSNVSRQTSDTPPSYNPQNNNPDGGVDMTNTVLPSIPNNSIVLASYGDTYNTSSSDTNINILEDKNGNNVTSEFKNNTEAPGTYYLASPLLVTLSNKDNQTYSLQNAIYVPISDNYNSVNKNVSGFNYGKYISQQLSNIIKSTTVFNNDFTISKAQNFNIVKNDDMRNSDSPSYKVNINVNENYAKFIQDASTKINSDLNNVKQYSIMSSEDMIDLNGLQGDSSQIQHDLTEPVDWKTVTDAGSTENDANNALSDVIHNALDSINNDYNDITNVYDYSSNINAISSNSDIKEDPNVTSGINNDKNIYQQASDLIKNDSSNPTASNVNNASYEVQQASNANSNAISLLNQARRYVYNQSHSKVPNIPSTPSTQSEINSYFTSMSASVSASVSGMQANYNSEIKFLNNKISSYSTNSNMSTTNIDSSEINSLNNAINSMKQNSNVPENTINDASLQSSFSNYISNDNTEINSLNNKINSMEHTTPANDAIKINSLNSKVNSIAQGNIADSSLQSSYNLYVNNTDAKIGSLTNRINTIPQNNPIPENNDDSALQSSYNSYINSTSAEINSLANQLNNSANSNILTNSIENSTAILKSNTSNTAKLNKLSIGQDIKYRNGVVTRYPMHYYMITINKPCLLHNHMFSVGRITDYAGTLKRGTTVKIIKLFSLKVGNHHKAYRYEINLNGHNYFVTANPTFTINTYIMPTEIKKHNRAVITKPCFMYIHGHKKLLRHGNSIRIKRVIYRGKITRLKLTNGAIVTANKKFVKLI